MVFNGVPVNEKSGYGGILLLLRVEKTLRAWLRQYGRERFVEDGPEATGRICWVFALWQR